MRVRRVTQAVSILLLVSMVTELTCVRFSPLRCQVFGLPFDLRLLAVLIPMLVMGIVLASFRYGRVFCSWWCPMHIFLEGIGWTGRQKQPGRGAVTWAGTVLLSALITLAVITCFVPWSMQLSAVREHGWSSTLLMVDTGLFLVFFILFGFVRQRFSLYACPYGLIMRLFKTDTTRVTFYDADAGRCIDCGACDRACPFELDVRQESTGDLCTNCGLCIKTCNGVLGPDKGVISMRQEAEGASASS
ncbi:MAG: 4Fe-4S binding protein [Verrucomicrobia bacterium]|nr:4Fe-4S binding protein [Verrucomicrobiota bacterium]